MPIVWEGKPPGIVECHDFVSVGESVGWVVVGALTAVTTYIDATSSDLFDALLYGHGS